jgi:hypothetical protein
MKNTLRLGGILAGCLLLAGCSLFGGATPTAAPLPSPTATLISLLLPPPTATVPAALPSPTSGPLPTAIVLPTFTGAPAATPVPQATSGPAIQSGSPSGPYGVILVASDDVLNIRSGPGVSFGVVDSFGPTASNVMRTGPSSVVDGAAWVEVQRPGGGAGWVNGFYLAEYLPPATFCADAQVTALIQNLKTAVTTDDGVLLAGLVSPKHGMTIQYNRGGTRVNYDAEHARWVFESNYQVNWGPAAGSGLDTVGSFQEIIQPKLVEVLSAAFTTGCNQILLGGASYVVTWPPELANIPFDSLYKPGTDANGGLDWGTWLMGVEYVAGKPYVFSLSYYAWEP